MDMMEILTPTHVCLNEFHGCMNLLLLKEIQEISRSRVSKELFRNYYTLF